MIRRLVARSVIFSAGALVFAAYLLLRPRVFHSTAPVGITPLLLASITGAISWGIVTASAGLVAEAFRGRRILGALAAWAIAACGNLVFYAQWSYAYALVQQENVAGALGELGRVLTQVFEGRTAIEVAIAAGAPVAACAFLSPRTRERGTLRVTVVSLALASPVLIDLLNASSDLGGLATILVLLLAGFLPRLTWFADRREQPVAERFFGAEEKDA